ncbi:hypothetical protein [Limimaricola cinnabarinus]|nr:hypothetical protein [Limimaricola cinnabarinus]
MRHILTERSNYAALEQRAELPEGWWLIPGALFGLTVWARIIATLLN